MFGQIPEQDYRGWKHIQDIVERNHALEDIGGCYCTEGNIRGCKYAEDIGKMNNAMHSMTLVNTIVHKRILEDTTVHRRILKKEQFAEGY